MAKTRQYLVHKTFTFDAAHHLSDMPEEHPCSHLHGHTYTVEVSLCALDLDIFGMAVDFNAFKEFRSILDHKNLNDVLDPDEYGQPTTENLCRFVWDWVDRYLWSHYGAEGRKSLDIVRVAISETGNNRVELLLVDI